MKLETLVESVQNATITADAFDHAAHLSVAAWYLEHMDLDTAHAELRVVLQRLLVALGVEQTATSGYHDTMTRAWLQLVQTCMRDTEGDLDARVAGVCAALADKTLILRYYSRESIMSPEARAGWIEPDLASLDALITL